jgi:hypothetical protein
VSDDPRERAWGAIRRSVLALFCIACGAPGAVDAGPARDATVDGGPPPPATNTLDLLFVIDDSGVSAPLDAFERELPGLLNVLRTGDLNRDGMLGDWEPAAIPWASIHFAVITTDMGCGEDRGRDGRFYGCEEPIVRWEQPGAIEPTPIACAIDPPDEGCEIEQPLEAILTALSPGAQTEWTAIGYEPPVLPEGSSPRGGEGFLRPGSILAIVVITNGDDCSVRDEAFFTSTEPTAARCVERASALHDIERFAGGLAALRRHPSRLAFYVWAGIPVDLDFGSFIAFDTLRSDARMRPRIDPATDMLAPSCSVPGVVAATPPARLVLAAEQLMMRGARVGVSSLCREDTGALPYFLMSIPR